MNVLDLLQCCQDCYSACGIVAGPAGRDGANVVKLPSGDVVVAIRGTVTALSACSLLDWINDFYAVLTPAPGFSGRIHTGFLAVLDSLWGGIFDALEQPPLDGSIAELPWQKKLWITGHSLGGAVAQLAGVRLAALRPRVVTFGSPKVGDLDFALGYPDAITLTRYESSGDVVPFLPPFGYRGVGKAIHETALPSYLLPMHIDKIVAGLPWEQIVQAHRLDTYRAWLSGATAPPLAG